MNDNNPMDRSLAYTLLLETDQEFGKLTVREGEQRVTEFVQAWRAAVSAGDHVTMGEFLGRAPKEPRRLTFLHNHYAANAVVAGHEASCAMVTTFVNWPTMSGRPACTCRVGGNTAEAQISWRKRRDGESTPDYAHRVLPEHFADNKGCGEDYQDHYDSDPAPAWSAVAGLTHSHGEPGFTRSHNHADGHLPHRHDPDSGFQVPLSGHPDHRDGDAEQRYDAEGRPVIDDD